MSKMLKELEATRRGLIQFRQLYSEHLSFISEAVKEDGKLDPRFVLSVYHSFIDFLVDPEKWGKTTRMAEQKFAVEERLWLYFATIVGALQSLGLSYGSLREREMFTELSQRVVKLSPADMVRHQEKIDSLLQHVQSFQKFVESNLTKDTDTLSRIVVRVSSLYHIQDLLSEYPDVLGQFSKEFTTYAHEAAWEGKDRAWDIDNRLSYIVEALEGLGAEHARPASIVLANVKRQLESLFQSLDRVDMSRSA